MIMETGNKLRYILYNFCNNMYCKKKYIFIYKKKHDGNGCMIK